MPINHQKEYVLNPLSGSCIPSLILKLFVLINTYIYFTEKVCPSFQPAASDIGAPITGKEFEEVVYVTCNVGHYTSLGDSHYVARCAEDGHWNNTRDCLSKLIIIISEKIVCLMVVFMFLSIIKILINFKPTSNVYTKLLLMIMVNNMFLKCGELV